MASAKLSRLSSEESSRYITSLTTALHRARLNRQYPDSRATADHLQLMSPSCHRGLYDGLEIDSRSGLPSYREWVRVKTDRTALGDKEWSYHPPEELERRATRDPQSVFGKQLLEYHYRRELRAKQLVNFDHVQVELIRIIPAQRTAQFRIIMDKLGVEGSFTRTSIELSQTNDSWNQEALRLEGENVAHTTSFRTLIYSMSSTGAEMLFHRLEADEMLEVGQVTRGTIGPIFMAGIGVPEGLEELIGRAQHPVFSFALDSASRQQKQSRFNDPFAAPTLDQGFGEDFLLSARQRHGYQVFRDRKFVVEGALAEKLQEACRARGTRNIVYKL